MTAIRTISPRGSRRSGAEKILYRTVQNCGRVLGVTICAMMFPPKAGLICTRSVFSFISSLVQSAVSPARIRAAAFGASERPRAVAPTRTDEGFAFFRKSIFVRPEKWHQTAS